MNCTVRDRRVQHALDGLFGKFTDFLRLLSPNAMSWSFCLVTLFFDDMSSELQESVQLR